jgi:hypothetical protein
VGEIQSYPPRSKRDRATRAAPLPAHFRFTPANDNRSMKRPWTRWGLQALLACAIAALWFVAKR